MGSSFRELAVYEMAARLADDLRVHALSWPSFDRWSLGLQLMRAADSIGANVAEATGRWHPADKRRLLMIARGSLYETEHWVLRAEERGLLAAGYRPRLDEIARTLNGLMRRPNPR
jgi:four helix bundle protein